MSFGQNPFGISSFGESYEQADTAFTLTGVVGTGAVTAVEAKAAANVAATGIEATGFIGTTIEAGRVVHGVTGVAGTSTLGTILITGGAGTVISITGVSATGSANGITFGGDANVPLTGVSATCITDDPLVNGDEITPEADAVLSTTGVAGTTALGTAIGKGGSTNIPTGLEATGTAGSLTIVGKCIEVLPTLIGTTSLNTVVPDCQAVVLPVGVQGTFTVGDETIDAVQFDYESIKDNYSRDRTAYIGEFSTLGNTAYVRAA